MPRKTQKAKLVLSKEQQEELKKTVQSRKAPSNEERVFFALLTRFSPAFFLSNP